MEHNPAGAGWSVPGSLAEPEEGPGPLPPGAVRATGTAQTPRRDGSFAGAGPVAEPVVHADEDPAHDGAAEAPSAPDLDLQPMTVADILDGAFAVIKARPARILGMTAVWVVPLHLVVAYLQREASGGESLLEAFSSQDPTVQAEAARTGSESGQFWAVLATWLIPGVALVFVAAALAHLVAAWTSGRDLGAGVLLRVVGRRSWALLVSFVLVHLAEAAAIVAFYIGPVFIMAFFVVTAPVIGAEGLGPLAAMKRAGNLASRRYWRSLGVGVLIGLVAVVLANALGGLPQTLAYFAGYDLAWPLIAAGNILGAVITTPFVAAATVLLYLDLRMRTEGLDLELAAIDLGHDVP